MRALGPPNETHHHPSNGILAYRDERVGKDDLFSFGGVLRWAKRNAESSAPQVIGRAENSTPTMRVGCNSPSASRTKP